MNQQSFDEFLNRRKPDFNGPAYDKKQDKRRLTGQILRIFNLMSDGHWRTLHEISMATYTPEASVSAQLRHLRKNRFGAHAVDRHALGDGLWEYRLTVNGKGTK